MLVAKIENLACRSNIVKVDTNVSLKLMLVICENPLATHMP